MKVACAICDKDYCSYCIALKNMQKCKNCDKFFGICNDCEIKNPEGVRYKINECMGCSGKVCYDCYMQY